MWDLYRLGACLLVLFPGIAGPAGNHGVNDEQLLSSYAGAPLRVFDPFAEDAIERFTHFLETVRMLNHRPVPERLRRETATALRLLTQSSRYEPTYFVATYFERATLHPGLAEARADTIARYGEEVFPQLTCPVFASRANGDVPAMLSAASGLPRDFFIDAPGQPERYHDLFLLTEVSHCGFLARIRQNATLVAQIRSAGELRILIEAVGDFEAIAAFRRLEGSYGVLDEADVLRATRIVAMFLTERADAYTYIPALTLAFEGGEMQRAGQSVAQLRRSVDAARYLFDRFTGSLDRRPYRHKRTLLRDLADTIEAALAVGPGFGQSGDDLALDLLRAFPDAVDVLLGEPSVRTESRRYPKALLTLPGVPLASRTHIRKHGRPATGI